MGQMFNKTCDQIHNWRWDNPHAFGVHVDRSTLQPTSPGKIKCAGERFSSYGSDNLRVKVEPPSCHQYKLGDFPAVRTLNQDGIIDEDEDDENWADPGALSGARSRPGNGNENDNGDGEEDTRGGETMTGKGKGTKDGKGRGKATEDWMGKWKGNGKAMEDGKGKGKGNSKGRGSVEQTRGGDDIFRAVALGLQKEMYEADSDMEG